MTAISARKRVLIYTDGACSGNPGPGGLGVVLLYGDHRREIVEGYRLTTNNRMELLAAIRGLEALKEPCQVRLVSDSEYVVNAMNAGWPEQWRSRGWRLSGRQLAKNVDLWSHFLDLVSKHDVSFEWVRGHSGNPENERCDVLATTAATREHDWVIDEMFESQAKVR